MPHKRTILFFSVIYYCVSMRCLRSVSNRLIDFRITISMWGSRMRKMLPYSVVFVIFFILCFDIICNNLSLFSGRMANQWRRRRRGNSCFQLRLFVFYVKHIFACGESITNRMPAPAKMKNEKKSIQAQLTSEIFAILRWCVSDKSVAGKIIKSCGQHSSWRERRIH